MTTCINLPRFPLLLMIAAIFCTAVFSPGLVAGEVSKAEQEPEFTRSEANYQIPDITLVRKDGQKLSFLKELDDGRPVFLNFIFSSCSAICPMLSHTFSQVQTQLEKDKQKFHLVSVSIDPEHDSPATLTEYAKKFKAGANWDFYTGSQKDSIAIQKAFNAFRGDKMNHASLVFMRSAPGQPWVRLEGLLSSKTLIQEFNNLPGKDKK